MRPLLSVCLLLLVALVGAAPPASVKLCFLFFSGVSDLGWTHTYNIARLDMLRQLELDFPNTTVEAVTVSDVFFMPPAARDALIDRLAGPDRCAMVLANSDFIAPAAARRHPAVSFVSVTHDPPADRPPNLLLLDEQVAPAFFALGAAAATQSRSAVCILPALAPPSNPGLAAAFFLAGVRSVAPTLRVHVATIGAWYNPAVETVAAAALIDLGCDVVARYSDPFDVDKLVAARPGNVTSMGTHIPLQHFVGDTALTSVRVAWLPTLLPYLRSVVANGTLHLPLAASFKGVGTVLEPVSVTARSGVAAAAAKAMLNNSTAHGLCSGSYHLLNGNAAPRVAATGCLDLKRLDQHLADPHTTYHSTVSFPDGPACPGATFYRYTPDGPGGALRLQCLRCPVDTYRPPTQLKAAPQCTACPSGEFADAGSTTCSPPPDRTVAIALSAALGTLLVAVVAVAAALAAHRWVLRSRIPRDPAVPFAAFFVSVDNEAAVRDAFGAASEDVFAQCRRVVVREARRHGCHPARHLDAHHLVVATTAESALRCALALHKAFRSEPWPAPPAAPAGGTEAVLNSSATVRVSLPSRGPSKAPSRRVSHLPSASASRNPSGQSSPTHSARTLGTHARLFVPVVSIGLDFGLGTVDVDGDHYAHGGAVVRAAARHADVAEAGTLVLPAKYAAGVAGWATQRVDTDAEEEDEDTGAPHDALVFLYPCYMPSPVAALSGASTPSQSLDAQPHRGQGALAAALEQATGGLTVRRSAFLAVNVPDLRTPPPPTARERQQRTARIAAVCACVDERMLEAKAALVGCGADGLFVFGFNALMNTSRPADRAAAAAHDVCDLLANRFGVDAVCGLAIAPAVVGELPWGQPHRHDGTARLVAGAFGTAVEQARALALMGEAVDDSGPCLAQHGRCPELLCPLRVLDLAAMPRSAGGHTAPIAAVLPARALDEDEWMYQLQQASGHDEHTYVNEAFASLCAGQVPLPLPAHAFEVKAPPSPALTASPSDVPTAPQDLLATSSRHAAAELFADSVAAACASAPATTTAPLRTLARLASTIAKGVSCEETVAAHALCRTKALLLPPDDAVYAVCTP